MKESLTIEPEDNACALTEKLAKLGAKVALNYFNSPKEDKFLFRAASGHIKGSNKFIVRDSLEIELPGAEVKNDNLIKSISLPAGKSKTVIKYRLIK